MKAETGRLSARQPGFTVDVARHGESAEFRPLRDWRPSCWGSVMGVSYDRLREVEPLPRRHAALIYLVAATAGWALTLATFYGVYVFFEL